MFETLAMATLAFRGEKGEDVLSNQKEVDKYRVCSGDNFSVFGPWLGYHTNGSGGVDPHEIEPWSGFVPTKIYRDASRIDFDQYKPCTGFVFE
jgi:hypothetical protein